MTIIKTQQTYCDLCGEEVHEGVVTRRYWYGTSRTEIEMRNYNDYLEVDLCQLCVEIISEPKRINGIQQQIVANRVFNMRGRKV